jgi:periplasmic mercuric ion binding protein
MSCPSSTDLELIMIKKLLACAALIVAGPSWAGTQTVTLSVPGMTCAACPITVKRALTRVDGVTEVDVSFERREAVVTYDDAKTDIRALTRTTGHAGYPSSVATSTAR